MAKAFQDLLRAQQYCLLTTFRKDGSPVATPMWFALDGEEIVMMTKGQTGKVKRLRSQDKVTVGPCHGGGRPTGPQVQARARVVTDPQELARVEKILNNRYGLKRKILRWALRWAKDKTDAAILVTASK